MVSTSPPVQTLGASSEMRERIGSFNWAATPLGPRESWPPPLCFAVSLCERSAVPMAVYWGRDLRLVYNDGWQRMAGDRHPAALGQRAEDVWSDIWPIVGPQFDRVWRSGEGLFQEGLMLPIRRDGIPEETYWSYALTPICNGQGTVVGILSQGNEVTEAFLARRRLAFQVGLADALRQESEPEDAKAVAARLLGMHLQAARVGYSEVDSERQTLSTSTDWTRESSIPSLVGVSRLLSAFGKNAYSWLMTGAPLVASDHRTDPRTAEPAVGATLDELGIRSMIVVPLVQQSSLRAILYATDDVPRHWTAAEVEIVRDVAERTWAAVEHARSEKSLRDSEDHYRHAVELNPQASWTATADGLFNRVSTRWEDWSGVSGLGRSWLDALPDKDRRRVEQAWDRSIATGEPFDVEHCLIYRDGASRWVRTRAFPRRDSRGDICLWYGTTEDIHARHQAEEHQRLLINELNHRVKNTLATVQAIAYQTLKGDLPLTEARRRFEARLLALSRAHTLLTEENWEGAPIWRVILDSVAHLSEEKGRFCLDGDPLWLAPRAALALALACHELSTNAVKYGALSSETGHVDVRWSQTDGRLRIDWKERGGPLVRPPKERGFGSRLIERGLAGDLEGSARLDFEPDGLHCVIEAPLRAVLSREEQREA